MITRERKRVPLFGERAVAYGFVQEAAVLAALRAQHEARILFGKHLFLGEILLLQGKLTARQLTVLLSDTDERHEEAGDVREKRFFGDVAIDMGFCTAQHVFEALNIQRATDSAVQKHRLVGEILFERGYMTKEQVEHVVARMVTAVAPASAPAPTRE